MMGHSAFPFAVSPLTLSLSCVVRDAKKSLDILDHFDHTFLFVFDQYVYTGR